MQETLHLFCRIHSCPFIIFKTVWFEVLWRVICHLSLTRNGPASQSRVSGWVSHFLCEGSFPPQHCSSCSSSTSHLCSHLLPDSSCSWRAWLFWGALPGTDSEVTFLLWSRSHPQKTQSIRHSLEQLSANKYKAEMKS